MSVDYWDEVLAMERRLVGPHFPNISNALFKNWAAIGETIMNGMSRRLAKKWKDLAIEMEKEFVITHGKEHPDYYKIVANLEETEVITKMMRL